MPGLLRLSRERIYLTNELRSLGFNTEPRLLFAHRARFRRAPARGGARPGPAARSSPRPTRMGCKRILMSNDWYQALQLPQVEVVTDRIAEVRAALDRHRRRHRARGRHDRARHRLRRDGVPRARCGSPAAAAATCTSSGRTARSAHLGTVVPGFPNLFVLYGPNTNLGHNSILVMLEAQIGWVVQAVRPRAVPRGGSTSAGTWPRPPTRGSQERVGHTVFAGGCHSWYLTASGRNTQNWPASTLTFRRRLRRFRLEEFEPAPVPVGDPVGQA